MVREAGSLKSNLNIFFAGSISDKINASKERSLSIKSELDSLVIPDFANKYMCNTSLEETVQQILNSGQKITIGLTHLKGIFIKRYISKTYERSLGTN